MITWELDYYLSSQIFSILFQDSFIQHGYWTLWLEKSLSYCLTNKRIPLWCKQWYGLWNMKRVTGDYDYILIPKHKVLQEHKKTKNLLKWFLFHNFCDLNSELKKKCVKIQEILNCYIQLNLHLIKHNSAFSKETCSLIARNKCALRVLKNYFNFVNVSIN